MDSRSNGVSDSGLPEYAVRWETNSRFFEPPMPSSTFHDFVNKWRIIPVKGIRGFYQLNESFRRLGLRGEKGPLSRASERNLE